jgi:outer membrane protein assembly factor BamB
VADQRWSTLTASHVYLISPRGLQVFETATGKKTADVPQGEGHRTCMALVADRRLFIQPEGRHGSQGFKMFDLSDPAQPKPLGAADKPRKLNGQGEVEFDNETLWRPPHPFTTAYASHPITYPVVDGRIFIRGASGIFCYDLREPTGK